jgi:hypothetical protein
VHEGGNKLGKKTINDFILMQIGGREKSYSYFSINTIGGREKSYSYFSINTLATKWTFDTIIV